MIPDNQEFHVYGPGSYSDSLHGRCLGLQQQQQQQHIPELDLGLTGTLGGETFTHITGDGWTRIDPYIATTTTTDTAGQYTSWHPPMRLSESWQWHNFYQTIRGKSTIVATPRRQAINIPSTSLSPSPPYIDNSDTQQALLYPPNDLPADPTTFIEDLLAATTSREAIQILPSFSKVVLYGIKYYQCACGHLAQRMGDMRRHHESDKHAFRRHFCSICGLGFTRKDSLKRHKKKKHP